MSLKNYDCVFGEVTYSDTEVNSLHYPVSGYVAENVFSGKLAASFGTRLKGEITGNAAKGIEKKLKNSVSR